MQTSNLAGLNHKTSEKKQEEKMSFLSFTCLPYGSRHLPGSVCVCVCTKTPDTVAHLLVESTMREGVVSIVGLGGSAVELESTGRNSAMAETKHKALTEKCVPKSLLPFPAGKPEELSAAATRPLAGTQNAATTSRGHSFICTTGGSHRGSEIHNMQLPSITSRLCLVPVFCSNLPSLQLYPRTEITSFTAALMSLAQIPTQN